MSNPTKTERKSDFEIVVSRTFDAPAHVVFRAWTTPELFQKWWIPPSFGITLVSCELDARTGGSYRIVLSHPDFEQPMEFIGKFLEVTPPSRIVWTNEEDAIGPVTSVTFQEQDGKTYLELAERYPSKEALDEAIANGSTGTSGAPDQFELLDELLVTLVKP